MTSLPRPRSVRLFAPAVVALLALGGLACSGDDGGDDATATTPSSEVTTTSEATTTTAGDDAATTTVRDDDDDDDDDDDGEDRPAGDLASRLPEIEGYQREVDDDDGGGITDEHCDGSDRSVEEQDEASATYFRSEGDPGSTFTSVSVLRFASEAEASAAYGDFVSTTNGCEQDGANIDQGTSSGLGDEGMSWNVEFDDGDARGIIYISRAGTELWFLSVFSDSTTVPEPVLAAYTTAFEG